MTPPSNPGGSRVQAGIRHMVASAFFFSVMSMLVKLAGVRLPFAQLMLARSFVCLVLSWTWVRRAGLWPWGSNPRLLVLRGLLGTLGQLCLYFALVTLPLADAVVIAHMAPIFTALLAALLLGEAMSRRLVAAIVCCAAGLLAIARPPALFGAAAAPIDQWGVLAGFTGALASACVYVLIRRLRHRENALVVVFYFPLVTTPVILPFAVAAWVWPTPFEWIVLLGIGVATQIAQVQMTHGLVLLPAGRATSISYIQVVLAALWGAVIFGEVPDLLTLGGAALILTATLALAMSRAARRDRDEEGIVAS